MTQRLSGPTFEPIYELDQRIDTIDGYDHLQLAVHALATQYPEDEYHTALEQSVQASLAVCRKEAVSEAIALRAQLRGNSIGTKITTEGGVPEATAEYSRKKRAAQKIQKAGQKHLAAFFAETGLEGHETMQGIVQTGVDKATGELEEASRELAERKATVDQARAILSRPFNRVATPLESAGYVEGETLTDPAALGFNRVAAILRLSRSGVVHERSLIRALYPDLYDSDRPAAYKQFDEMFAQFASLSQRFTSTHGFMQKGALYPAKDSGRAINGNLGAVYRTVGNDDEEIIRSKGGMQQRIALRGTPHVIVWEAVTPKHRKRVGGRPSW